MAPPSSGKLLGSSRKLLWWVLVILLLYLTSSWTWRLHQDALHATLQLVQGDNDATAPVMVMVVEEEPQPLFWNQTTAIVMDKSLIVSDDRSAQKEKPPLLPRQGADHDDGTTTSTTISIVEEQRKVPSLLQTNDSLANISLKLKTKLNNHTIIKVRKKDYIMNARINGAPIVIEQYKLIFFTIQKTGCTVWKQLFRKMMGYDDWRTGPTWGTKTGLKQLRHSNLTQATLLMNDPSYTRAIFVRDPKERFLSAFLDKAIHTEYVDETCCRKKKTLETQEQCRHDSQNFTNFVQMTRSSSNGNGNSKGNGGCLDPHWTPQWQRLEERYWPLLNFVGHLETAAQDAKRLLQNIGAWEDHGQTGWGHYGNESIFESTSNVQHKTATATTTVVAKPEEDASYQTKNRMLAKYFTPETEIELEERFAKDYSCPQFRLPLKKIDFSKA
jgi:hypothetical protein